MTTSADRPSGSARAEGTRRALLAAAERLFAERGISAVTHRQITDAAGQGNNAAVVYHFGTKDDLVVAIEEAHAGPIEERRQRLIDELDDSADLRTWVTCLVAPLIDHLATSGTPTWYARFAAQCAAEPAYHRLVTAGALRSPSLQRVVAGLERNLSQLPQPIRTARDTMALVMLLHSCAEFERAFADGNAPLPDWPTAGAALIDALVGLWGAPITDSGAIGAQSGR